jgi:hypothetical protein
VWEGKGLGARSDGVLTTPTAGRKPPAPFCKAVSWVNAPTLEAIFGASARASKDKGSTWIYVKHALGFAEDLRETRRWVRCQKPREHSDYVQIGLCRRKHGTRHARCTMDTSQFQENQHRLALSGFAICFAGSPPPVLKTHFGGATRTEARGRAPRSRSGLVVTGTQ